MKKDYINIFLNDAQFIALEKSSCATVFKHEFANGNLLIKSGKGSPLFMNKGGVYEDNSQTALLWMLKLGFYNSEEMKDAAIKLLVKDIKERGSLSVGFLGTNVILPVLSDVGESQVAYDLLLNDKMPSWLFEVKAGATTIWERWNSYTPEVGFGDCEMNSFNHFAYGSVVEWMYEYMLGIKPTFGKGFKEIILKPVFDFGEKCNNEERINRVKGMYKSPLGKISVEWENKEGNITYSVEIPENTTATLYLPLGGTYNLNGGKHSFSFKNA